jgi:two-component system, NarL family, response regulator NreC
MSKITVILVDDHALVRSGLRMLLEAQPDIEIVSEAETGADALQKVQSLQPDVVLMDIELPDMNGIEVTRLIKRTVPHTAVLALTMYEKDQYFFEMLKAGASGYVPKRAAPDDLVAAIRTASQGDVFLYPPLATRLVKDYLQRTPSADRASMDNELTPREQQVLVLIAEGLTSSEISDRLVISIKTVDRHRENIMHKLNLHSRVELVKYALRNDLIELDQ